MNIKTLFPYTKSLSLLLVEDYAPLRHDMLEILQDIFQCVTTASNGEEGLQVYKEYYQVHNKSYDLVISDIQMPVMNGVELSEAILNLVDYQPIIILSAHTDSEYLLEFINLGIAQFVVKPLKDEELFRALFEVCKKIEAGNREQEKKVVLSLHDKYVWDIEKALLKYGDIEVQLTRHERIFMEYMAKRHEKIFTNDDIVAYFYTRNIDITDKSIRNIVSKIRKKTSHNLIKSIYGMGYQLTR